MRKTARKLAAVTGGLVMAAGGITANTAVAAQAPPSASGVQADCYGGSVAYSKPDGNFYYPTSSTARLTTSSNCTDINVRPATNRYIKVCFYPSSGGSYCQADYTYARSGQWNVIATDVGDGTKYRLLFNISGAATGRVAD
ncbi:hypothetical protein [Streptomyces enissocaesilis]|uniref:Peptidase inhibitor family I36 n=1 Tax=Streptomyces enissocaesilis TaxID=332589 RepID=A0ABN3XFS6_9ACTN